MFDELKLAREPAGVSSHPVDFLEYDRELALELVQLTVAFLDDGTKSGHLPLFLVCHAPPLPCVARPTTRSSVCWSRCANGKSAGVKAPASGSQQWSMSPRR